MPTPRSIALALLLAPAAAAPAAAATCNLTVLGAHVIDDEPCTATRGRGVTRVAVGGGDAIVIRGSTMSGRLLGRPPVQGRPIGPRAALGTVVRSSDSDDRTCWFGQKATLCLEP